MSLVQVPVIDDVVGSEVKVSALLSLMKTRVQKASGVKCMLDIDDEETTDVGQSSASDNESSSGLSGNEASYKGKRCRFGKTSLETIPGTPSAFPGTPSAGVSRAAMRQARDSCQTVADAKPSDTSGKACRFGTTPLNTVPKTPTGGVSSQDSPPGLSRAALRQARDGCHPGAKSKTAEVPASIPAAVCRFGKTGYDTVPKTPVGMAKLRALKSVYGSPPGLSHTSLRQERDACKKEEVTATPSWGSSATKLPASPETMFQAPARALGALARIKQEAALLKDLRLQKQAGGDLKPQQEAEQSDEEDEDEFASFCDSTSDVDGESSPEVAPVTNDQPCRFDVTAFGTVPATPLGGKESLLSPPGLSRSALRQARDAARQEAKSVSWGSCKGAVLTTAPPAAHAVAVQAVKPVKQIVSSLAPR